MTSAEGGAMLKATKEKQDGRTTQLCVAKNVIAGSVGEETSGLARRRISSSANL